MDACPSRIIPSRLADYAQHHDAETFEKMNGMECVECGSCSYVCPAKRPLKQSIGSMRKIVLAESQKEKITREEEVNKSGESVKYFIFTTYTFQSYFQQYYAHGNQLLCCRHLHLEYIILEWMHC